MLNMSKKAFGYHITKETSILLLLKRTKQFPSIVMRMATHTLLQVMTKL